MIRLEGDRMLLSGEVTYQTVTGLLAQGPAAQGGGVAAVDMGGVTRADSSALALLLEWLRAAGRSGVPLRVANLTPDLISLARLYGVEDLLGAATGGEVATDGPAGVS
jgi:phospholipid transport system transporter-binding protein